MVKLNSSRLLGIVAFVGLIGANSSSNAECLHHTTERLIVKKATPNMSDWPPSAIAIPQAQLNEPSKDKHFRHTFYLQNQINCPIVAATLTVQMTVNANGAANDSMSILLNGASLPTLGGYIYENAPQVGQRKTKVFFINGANLHAIIAAGRLSFGVQDDTTVNQVVLRIIR